MSGETEQSPSGFTVDTAYQHLRDVMNERDRRYGERFDAQALAVQAALAAAEKAVLKAETAAEKRFEGVNEFRAQLSDQAQTFMPRAEADLAMSSMQKQIDELKGTRRGGLEAGWTYIVGVVIVAGSVIAAVIAIASN